jgi:VRR-NUC domain
MGARRRDIFEPSEDEITAAVVEHWRIFRVPHSLVASIPNKRAFGQPGLTPGLPDLLVLSPKLGESTGYIELKRTRGGRLSDAQLIMRELFLMRRAPYAVCYGRDEPIERLRAWGAIR